METVIAIGIVVLAAAGVGYRLYRGATGKSGCAGCRGCGDLHADWDDGPGPGENDIGRRQAGAAGPESKHGAGISRRGQRSGRHPARASCSPEPD
jgi:hypothetical protein